MSLERGKSLHDIEQVRLKKVRMERRLEWRGGWQGEEVGKERRLEWRGGWNGKAVEMERLTSLLITPHNIH